MIDNGTVGCRRLQQDVDIEQCFLCPWFTDLTSVDGVAQLYCKPPAEPPPAEMYRMLL